MASSRLIYSIYENRLQKRLLKEKLPKHIGLIHDGHRRYAKKEGLLSFEVSYKIGMNRFKDCLAWCDNVGIEYITSWLLSIGSIDMLPPFLQETISKLKEVRSGGQKTLTIALGYGGRQEILDAIKGLIDENRNDANDFDTLLENVTDEQLRQHLYSPETPDIDLIIRTSGESRLSGFLLWQSAYSEVIFQDVYWPEFRKIDFLRCLREYAQRERRFGQ